MCWCHVCHKHVSWNVINEGNKNSLTINLQHGSVPRVPGSAMLRYRIKSFMNDMTRNFRIQLLSSDKPLLHNRSSHTIWYELLGRQLHACSLVIYSKYDHEVNWNS